MNTSSFLLSPTTFRRAGDSFATSPSKIAVFVHGCVRFDGPGFAYQNAFGLPLPLPPPASPTAITSGRPSPFTSSTNVRKNVEYWSIVNVGGFGISVPPSAKSGPAYQRG